MKRLFALILGTIFLSLALPVTGFAKDTPSSKPSITYGSTLQTGSYEYYGPHPTNKWSYFGGAYKYHSWDKDSFEAINYQANVSLSSTSSTTYTTTGSTEFGFKDVAKINIAGSLGSTWGKTSTVTFDATAGYVYELWSANRIHIKKFIHPRDKLFDKKTYYAQALDKDGTYKWFFRTKR